LAKCLHRNIVKIKAASFDGNILSLKGTPECFCFENSDKPLYNKKTKDVIKCKGEICYFVMKLAEYGELFRLVEMNNRFSEDLVKYFFNQLIQGLSYLHSQGIVHRDIKPENLLIDRKFKLIIADFNFATKLEKV